MGESPEFCLAGREEIKVEAWIANAQVRVHRDDMQQTFLQLQVIDLRIACPASSKSTIGHLKVSNRACVARQGHRKQISPDAEYLSQDTFLSSASSTTFFPHDFFLSPVSTELS
jgi:hypothetical protein